MRRRDFLALITAATAFPRNVFAQQQLGGWKRVGLLFTTGNPDGSMTPTGRVYADALRSGLKEEGFIDGANVILDIRLGLNDPGLTRSAAHDLVHGAYDVLVGNGTPGTAALVAETKTIPIVFASASDPIGSGWVRNFARPESNVTGFTNLDASMAGKWLGILHQVAPGVRRAVMMHNPDIAPGSGNFFLPSFRAAAATLGIEPVVAEVRTLAEIDAAIATMGKAPETGLVMGVDNFTFSNRRTVPDAIARENMMAVYPFPEFVEDGGLIGYGCDIADLYRRAGAYAGLILKGLQPSELPVQAPTKFVLSVNLKTAGAQGITIPPTLIALADEVIG